MYLLVLAFTQGADSCPNEDDKNGQRAAHQKRALFRGN